MITTNVCHGKTKYHKGGERMSILVEQPKNPGAIEPYFYQFCQQIIQKLPNVDPELVVKTLVTETSLRKDHPTRSKPHLNLYVYYKDGVDLHSKQEEGRDKYPIQIAVSRWHDGVIMSGLVNMKNLEMIASDPDIVKITGKVSAAMY